MSYLNDEYCTIQALRAYKPGTIGINYWYDLLDPNEESGVMRFVTIDAAREYINKNHRHERTRIIGVIMTCYPNE